MFSQNNEIIKGREDDWFVSYLADSSSTFGLFSGDNNGSETALIKRDFPSDGKRTCLILNGDWRERYKAEIPNGWGACLALYLANRAEHRSSWSEDDKLEVKTAVN